MSKLRSAGYSKDELWFNTVIGNPPEIQTQLRALPYTAYLETEHWKRVRAAMLLIRDVRCQEIDCYASGETWHDVENGLHVHHVTYQNRGNERYQDLLLLCDAHHRKLHDDMKLGKKSIEVVSHETPTLLESFRDLQV